MFNIFSKIFTSLLLITGIHKQAPVIKSTLQPVPIVIQQPAVAATITAPMSTENSSTVNPKAIKINVPETQHKTTPAPAVVQLPVVTPTPQPVIVPSVTAPVVQDHCANIDGIQTTMPDGYEYDINHNCVPIPVPPTPEQLQQQATDAYNAELKALEQQIIDIKTQYYIDYANLGKVPGLESGLELQEQKLTDDDNQKIDQINLQIQQLELNNQ
jgi:hypothetical protein